MERMVKLQYDASIAEGVYLATSDELQGLIAQGRTITETLKLPATWRESLSRRVWNVMRPFHLFQPVADQFDYP